MSNRRSHRLRSLFHAVLGATSGVTLLAACGASSDTIDAADFQTNQCRASALEGVTPGTPVDYLELRSGTQWSDSQGQAPRVIAQQGTPCATASSPDVCKRTLAALRPTNVPSVKGGQLPVSNYLVFTRGDDVIAVTTKNDLVAFLTPFENPRDGFLLVSEFTEHTIPCDGSNVRAAGDGFEFRTTTGYACGEGTHLDAHVVRVSRSGETSVVESKRLEDGDPGCAIGRRPEGYSATVKSTTIGEYFANAAELEAASVPAFRRLARELRAHGAPTELVERAKAAALDEVRHARATRALAKRFGASAKLPRIGKLGIRSLDEIAIENAREGCVRETFGALVATFQARRANDPEIAAAMAAIADDETEHAALAWDVAAWLDAQLDDAAREAVLRARTEAYEELADAVERPSYAEARLGLPSTGESLALLTELGGSLYGSIPDPLGDAA
ncbi:putative lipoprotein [Labilithrix luteola]|uniref:Putative lipoprotein n=1 Tax=Labilithrix luteola TaxID=1391654 RepID=A0A0K1PT91_9BACT|nr:ferritin-like domain-containing protein [Labilithrix luteola]AKU96750.1 putative lipoprotein [Labilithrix luteola]